MASLVDVRGAQAEPPGLDDEEKTLQNQLVGKEAEQGGVEQIEGRGADEELNLNGLQIDDETTPSLTIVVDVSCGFPIQKRPRKERINAVSRQIMNYLESFVAEGGDFGVIRFMVGGGEGKMEGEEKEVELR